MAKGGKAKNYTMWVELRGATEKFTQDMNSAVGKITRVEKQLTGVAKNIQRVFQAAMVIGGVAAINKFSSALNKLAEEGEKAGSIKDSFTGLGGTSASIENARKRVLGLVDSFDLMQLSNKGLLAGVPGWNAAFSQMADLGARVADTLGIDTKESIEGLTDAVIRGNAKALKPMGFAFSDVSDKAKVTREALAQLPDVLSRLAPISDSVANANQALGNTWGELNKQVGIAINENPSLISALRDLDEVVQKIDFAKLGAQLAELEAAVVRFVAVAVPALVGGLDKWQEMVDRLAAAMKVGPFASRDAQEREYEILREARAIDQRTTEINDYVKSIQDLYNKMQQGAKPSAAAVEALLERTKELGAAIKAAGGPKVLGFSEELSRAAQMLAELYKNREKHIVATANYQVTEDSKAAEKIAKKLADEERRAHEESIAFWQTTFENAITGVTFNLKDAFKQVAVGFAAELAASLTGISFSGGIKGFGGSLAQSMLSQSLQGQGGFLQSVGLVGAGSMLGEFGMSAAAAQGAGIAGPAMANGMFSSGSGILGSIGSAGPYVAAAYAAYKIADHFGLFENKRHPETQARRDVAGFLEERLGRNFVLGADSKFNTEAGFAALHKLDKESQGVWNGLAAAIVTTAGVSTKVTEQIAAALVENTGESIDAAKAMWKSLGLNAEKVQEDIIQAGFDMKKQWLEIEGQLEAVDRLATPGRDGKGDWKGAFQAIIDSNATGLEATTAVVDSAIEAAEANFKTFEEWKAALKTQFDPTQVDMFFQALSQRGVNDFDTLKNASTRTAGAIIADMQALGFVFEDLTKKIEEAKKAVDSMDGSTSGATAGLDVPKMARGGLVTRPTLAVVGDAGPEIVMPLNRFNAGMPAMRSAGAAGISIHIDARGAAPGVERDILRVMREVSDASVARGINNLVRMQGRGGRGVR